MPEHAPSEEVRKLVDDLDDELRQCLQIILTNAGNIKEARSLSTAKRDTENIERGVQRAVNALGSSKVFIINALRKEGERVRRETLEEAAQWIMEKSGLLNCHEFPTEAHAVTCKTALAGCIRALAAEKVGGTVGLDGDTVRCCNVEGCTKPFGHELHGAAEKGAST